MVRQHPSNNQKRRNGYSQWPALSPGLSKASEFYSCHVCSYATQSSELCGGRQFCIIYSFSLPVIADTASVNYHYLVFLQLFCRCRSPERLEIMVAPPSARSQYLPHIHSEGPPRLSCSKSLSTNFNCPENFVPGPRDMCIVWLPCLHLAG